ncbi:MAG: hypothetical protein KAU01_11625 [Candidatus Cloacimonetes bacterium]|nr:hypothetical protein [Candidatus Cloacimonadota bacterium]
MKPLVKYKTIQAYRNHFEKVYCKGNIRTFDKIPVYFCKSDFKHCFYETKKSKDDTFSFKRAKRIDWIKETLEDQSADLRCGWLKKKNKIDCKRRVAIVNNNYVVIILIGKKKDGSFKANFITAFVADKSIKKILQMPKWVKK